MDGTGTIDTYLEEDGKIVELMVHSLTGGYRNRFKKYHTSTLA